MKTEAFFLPTAVAKLRGDKVFNLRRVSFNTVRSGQDMSGIKQNTSTEVKLTLGLHRSYKWPISDFSIFTSDHIPCPKRGRSNWKQNHIEMVKKLSWNSDVKFVYTKFGNIEEIFCSSFFTIIFYSSSTNLTWVILFLSL